jgi:hypothetical protein
MAFGGLILLNQKKKRFKILFDKIEICLRRVAFPGNKSLPMFTKPICFLGLVFEVDGDDFVHDKRFSPVNVIAGALII